MGMIKDQKDIVITINHGVNEYDIELIHEIEKRIDSAIGNLGFARSTSSKSGNKCEFVYYQFAFAGEGGATSEDT